MGLALLPHLDHVARRGHQLVILHHHVLGEDHHRKCEARVGQEHDDRDREGQDSETGDAFFLSFWDCSSSSFASCSRLVLCCAFIATANHAEAAMYERTQCRE